MGEVNEIEALIGYCFGDTALLRQAMTHPSYQLGAPDAEDGVSYQRLEFLGDSILGAAVSDLLYRCYPAEPEGKLAQRKAALVSSAALAGVVERLGLPAHIRMSAGEESSGGRESQAIREDVGEALIGAIYLDGGYEAAFRFVAAHWTPLVDSLTQAPKDAKTALQEWAQGRGLPLPEYRMVEQRGAAHDPLFTIEVAVRGYPSQQAEEGSKRKAEQLAAEKMLQLLQGSK